MAKTVLLKNLCSIDITDGTHNTPTYSETGYMFLSSKNVVNEKIDWNNVMYIPESLHKELHKRIAPQKNDILLAKNGTTGVAALVDKDYVFDIYVSLALIRPNQEKIIPKYLCYAINSETSKRYFKKNLKGIGVPNLHLKYIRETPIILQPIEIQNQIVQQLDKVTDLIDKRKQQLAKLDELIKSRFVEMFGDPVTNSYNWSQEKLITICKAILGGGTPAKKISEFYTGNIPWVTPKDMKSIFINDSLTHITEEAIKNSSTKLIPQKSVLMVIRSGILKHSLPVAINNAPVTINQDMKAFLLNNKVLPEYLTYYFLGIKDDILSGVRSVTADNIDFKTFQNRLILVPPLDLQNQFAEFVEQTEKTKVAINHSLDKLETLKKALMQKYFG